MEKRINCSIKLAYHPLSDNGSDMQSKMYQGQVQVDKMIMLELLVRN